ncbi:MAG: glycosyltransferase family 2 protein [Planctomycetota bacterium]|jgi:dolichol-phosphate mannosyltransferase
MDKPEISVVIPAFNEAPSLDGLAGEIGSTLGKLKKTCEIVIVDDGSTDETREVLAALKDRMNNAVIVELRRNFGKSAALAAGCETARGDIIITCDADGQDRPEEIPKLLAAIEAGADVACGWRRKRRDGITKRIQSRLYNWLVGVLSGIRLHDINSGFKAFKKSVLDEVGFFGDSHRLIAVMAYQRGFKVEEIEIEHAPRKHGRSKYGPGRVPGSLLDAFAVAMLARYPRKPGRIFGCMGIPVGLAGFIICLYLVIYKIVHGTLEFQYPLLIFGVFLLGAGVVLALLALLAEVVNYAVGAGREYAVREVKRK